MDRKRLEALVWKHTHTDYKGKLEDGTKTVMSYESERLVDPTIGFLIPLSVLSEAQLLARLPSKIREKVE